MAKAAGSSLPAGVAVPNDERSALENQGQGGPYWARRGYTVFPRLCARCGEPMRITAFVTERGAVQRILKHLDKPPNPRASPRPAVHPAGTRTSIRAKAICSPRVQHPYPSRSSTSR